MPSVVYGITVFLRMCPSVEMLYISTVIHESTLLKPYLSQETGPPKVYLMTPSRSLQNLNHKIDILYDQCFKLFVYYVKYIC